MLLTLTTTHNPATDLGCLLHKNPEKLHRSISCLGKHTKLVHSAVVTPANVSDAAVLPELLHGEEARIWGDGAYQGKTDEIRRVAPRAQDHTNRRCRYKDRVDEAVRAKNRTKSRVRSKVEHVFGTLKLTFGFTKVRYRGLKARAAVQNSRVAGRRS